MDIFQQWQKAYEAPEDLTSMTDNMMRGAGGQNAPTGDFDPTQTSEETQQENGANVERGAMSDMDTMGAEDDVPMPDDGMGDMGGGMGDMGMDDGMGGGYDEFGEEQSPFQDPQRAQAVYKLAQNMNQFLNILKTTNAALGKYSAPASSEDLRKLFNSSIEHMAECENQLQALITDEFTPDNYAAKLRKYIALRQVYASSLEVLQRHFDLLETDQGKG